MTTPRDGDKLREALEKIAAWPHGKSRLLTATAMCNLAQDALAQPPAPGGREDEDHPDCTTDRERELYDALMGLAGHAMANCPSYRKWEQGGLVLAPVVARALRLRDAGCTLSPQDGWVQPAAYRWLARHGDVRWQYDAYAPHDAVKIQPLYATPPAPGADDPGQAAIDFCGWLRGFLGAFPNRDELTAFEANQIREKLGCPLPRAERSGGAT